ncbi:MAG: hypothetical protein ACPGLV_14400, partial [Bacteroidia bacterium]
MEIKRVVLFLVGILCFLVPVKGQTVTISEQVDTTNELSSGLWGANLPNYMSLVFTGGLTLNSNIDNFNGVSGRYYEVGLFYKRKLSNPISFICEVDYYRITNAYSENPNIILDQEYRVRQL